MKLDYFYGIDFGTTNSATVSLSTLGRLDPYGDLAGFPYPSFVAINKTTGVIHKGRDAWINRYKLEESWEIIRSVKTFLGHAGISWNIAGRTWTPEDIACEIFTGLKDRVAEHGNVLNNAVVAIPVGFGASKRKALRTAALRAGVSILSFISEPTAAFFNYYGDLDYYKKVAVFDWGGGTLDISLLSIEGDLISERATESDNFAGDEIDKKLAEYVHRKIASAADTPDILFDQMPSSARDCLLMQCEDAKRTLSIENESTIDFYYHCFGPISYRIRRAEFNELIKRDLERLVDKLRNAMKKARWSEEEIDKIILVGGSCKIVLLREMLHDLFGSEKCHIPENSDWSIAEGAATLAKEPGSYVAAHDFGVVLSDNSFFSLIEEGERINDLSKSFTFGLVEEANDAHLIFAERYSNGSYGSKAHDDFRRIGEYMSVPCFGFNFEPIEIEVNGDDDLVIGVKAKSQNRNNFHRREKIFEKAIKMRYKLPATI